MHSRLKKYFVMNFIQNNCYHNGPAPNCQKVKYTEDGARLGFCEVQTS